MRTFLLIIFLGFSLVAKIQVIAELSFDTKTKILSVDLENKYDKVFYLFPRMGEDDKSATYYVIEYKDNQEKILYSFSTYVFSLDPSFMRERFLFPKETRNYKLDLNTTKATNIHSVEVKLHIHARHLKTLFTKDISRTYAWNQP